MRFEGQVAAVTGGGSGIGAAICRRLADEGAIVAVLDLVGRAGAGDGRRAAPSRRDPRRRQRQRLGRRGADAGGGRPRPPRDHGQQRRGAGDVPRGEGQPADRAAAGRAGRRADPDSARSARAADRRRMAARDVGPPRRNVLRHAGRGPADGRAPRGHDRQHGLGVRHRGMHRTPALLRCQGRRSRLHEGHGEGSDRPGDQGQRDRARIHRHDADQGSGRRRLAR